MSSNRRTEPIKVRSTVARQAFERNGAGIHRSATPKRQRSRSDAKRHAIRESW